VHVTVCRIKELWGTAWLPHLIHLKLQDNLITHMGPLPNLPFLQTLDLSFNHITEFAVVQTLASFQHLRSLRVNDNPVQHEPNFYFSLQRLLPWTQHEFGHARRFPDDQQIRIIQQEAVLQSPDVVQACVQAQWGVGLISEAPFAVAGVDWAHVGDVAVPRRRQPEARDGVVPGRDAERAVPSRSEVPLELSQHELMMLEGAARQARTGQVIYLGRLVFLFGQSMHLLHLTQCSSGHQPSLLHTSHASWQSVLAHTYSLCLHAKPAWQLC